MQRYEVMHDFARSLQFYYIGIPQFVKNYTYCVTFIPIFIVI